MQSSKVASADLDQFAKIYYFCRIVAQPLGVDLDLAYPDGREHRLFVRPHPHPGLHVSWRRGLRQGLQSTGTNFTIAIEHNNNFSSYKFIQNPWKERLSGCENTI